MYYRITRHSKDKKYMLKLGHMKHKLNLSDGNSISYTANYHARFMSFSFESGYKKKIEDTIYFGCIINGVDEKIILFSQCHFFCKKKLRL